mgnify:CR=1 FL=1
MSSYDNINQKNTLLNLYIIDNKVSIIEIDEKSVLFFVLILKKKMLKKT